MLVVLREKEVEKRGPLGFKMGPFRRWLARRETWIKRPKFFKNPSSNPNGILIDTRTISREEAINVIARSEWAQNLATGWLKAFVPDLMPGTPKYEEAKWRIARRVSAGVI